MVKGLACSHLQSSPEIGPVRCEAGQKQSSPKPSMASEERTIRIQGLIGIPIVIPMADGETHFHEVDDHRRKKDPKDGADVPIASERQMHPLVTHPSQQMEALLCEQENRQKTQCSNR